MDLIIPVTLPLLIVLALLITVMMMVSDVGPLAVLVQIAPMQNVSLIQIMFLRTEFAQIILTVRLLLAVAVMVLVLY